MHNWRFLLLAFVAVIQPIASYTERGLVDGRQQRCDYRSATALRDSGLQFHGTHRLSKAAVEDRRLNQRADNREIHGNEVRESLRAISSSDRVRGDTLERASNTRTRLGRASQTEFHFARDGIVLQRESRGSQPSQRLGDSRKERFQEFRAERPSNFNANQRARLDTRLFSSRLSEDESRSQFRINNRHSMDLQNTRANRDNTQTQRSQETREIRASDWEREDLTSSTRVTRHLARNNAQRMDTKRTESRVQVNRNGNHDNLDHRFMNRDIMSSSLASSRVYNIRAYNNDELRMARATRATRSLDRDERRNTQFRQLVDEHAEQRDINRNRVANNRDSVLAHQRNIREATARSDKTANQRSRGASESRRDVSRIDFSSLGRDQFSENRLGSRRVTRRAKEIRLMEDRVSENSRRDSRNLERERSVENRRDVRDTPDMERNFRSLERVTGTRRDARSADRVRDSNNGKEFRNIHRESRIIMTDRVGVNSDRDFERNIEVRCTTRKNNKDSCTINRERSMGREMPNRDYERVLVVARALSADRFPEYRRNARNSVRDFRIAAHERATENQRDTRKVVREAKQLERSHTAEINTRTNFRDMGSIENEQSQLNRRDNRKTEHRIVRVEYNNRRDTRNIQERARSAERGVYERNTEGNGEDRRNIRLNRFSETRNSRNIHGQSRTRAASFESRRDYGTIGDEHSIAHRRMIRSDKTNVRSVRAEKLPESRKKVRKVNSDSRMIRSERLAENRRERSSENRRETRNIERVTRTMRTEETRGVGSRIINTVRSRDNLSVERRDHRMMERAYMRATQLDRRSRSVQRESLTETRHTFERNNGELERREEESPTRKREFLSMTRNPSHDENEAPTINWQYIFYTLQGLYICGVLTQLMNEKSAVKKTR